MKNIINIDLPARECNCNVRTLHETFDLNGKSNGKCCIFNGECRTSIVVYLLRCKKTNKYYIGKTKVYLKNRALQHFSDVWKIIENGKRKFGNKWKGTGGYALCDSFDKHFAQECRSCKILNQVKSILKEIVEVEILWRGNRIKFMKSVRSATCKICKIKRREIRCCLNKDKENVLNKNDERFGSWSCKCRFLKLSMNKMVLYQKIWL